MGIWEIEATKKVKPDTVNQGLPNLPSFQIWTHSSSLLKWQKFSIPTWHSVGHPGNDCNYMSTSASDILSASFLLLLVAWSKMF